MIIGSENEALNQLKENIPPKIIRFQCFILGHKWVDNSKGIINTKRWQESKFCLKCGITKLIGFTEICYPNYIYGWGNGQKHDALLERLKKIEYE